MASPFPGMDPYLESQGYWGDFHHRFIDCWCEAIADVLPDNYEARLDEYVQLVDRPPLRIRLVEPDLTVERTGKSGRRPAARTGTATLQPVSIPHVIASPRRQGYIKVLRRLGREVVTVVELLSPANKKLPGFRYYLDKRQALLLQEANVVELDLLLSGRRLPLSRPLPRGDYYYLVSRVERHPDCEVYAWKVGDPLPKLPMPLRAPDPDCHVDLQAVFATAYERGRYERSLDYAAKPPVRLDPELLARIRGRRK